MINWFKNKTLKHYKQFLKYSIFGIICFFVDYGLTVFLNYQFTLHYLMASSIGYGAGVLLNYFFSITWVFSKRNMKDIWHIELAIFLSIEIVALLIMNLFIFLSHDYLYIGFYIAKLLGNFAAFIWNYTIKHIFLFRAHPEEKKIYMERKKELYGKK
ncbi:MAG TPA: GtrA family protein [Candidatus Cloacimonadota bacterium]|nr:GtrA family protein [Candidatus Cloacimonadota bacterium]